MLPVVTESLSFDEDFLLFLLGSITTPRTNAIPSSTWGQGALSLSATTGAWNKCLKLHLPDLQKKYQVKYRAKVGCCICKSGIGLTEEDGFWVDARVLEETWADADEDELFTLDEIVGCNRFCRQLPGMLPAALNARKR